MNCAETWVEPLSSAGQGEEDVKDKAASENGRSGAKKQGWRIAQTGSLPLPLKKDLTPSLRQETGLYKLPSDSCCLAK